MPVVVVIDDDDDMRALLAMRLEVSGYEVHQAADGVAGLELIQGCRPDLVVTDWMMPGKTGIEVCRELRGDDALAGTPVLMVTARTTNTDRDTSLAAGATAVLTKPLKLGAFIECVRKMLEGTGRMAPC